MPTSVTLRRSSDLAPSINGRWYGADSPWNKRIPSNPKLHSNSANFVQGLKYVLGLTSGAETSAVRFDNSTTNPFAASNHMVNLAYSGVPAVGIADQSTPLIVVRVNYPPCGVEVSVPIPASMAFQSDTNALENSAVVMTFDGIEWDFFKITRNNQTPILSDQSCFTTADAVKYASVIAASHLPGWRGSGNGSSSRASGTYNGAGLVRVRDFQQAAGGSWDHAIAWVGGPISDGSVWPGHVTPATSGSESNNNGTMKANYCLPYGARWQLDPSLNIDQLNDDGTFTGGGPGSAVEWKKQYCRTLQKYGAYPVDDNSSGTGTAWTTVFQYPYQDFGSLGGFNPADDNIPASLYQYMRVLDWNEPANF